MELIVIDSLQGINQLAEYLKPFEYIAYDCETTGLDNSARVIGFSVAAEEDKAYYIILEKWENGLVSMPYLQEARALILGLKTKKLLMHNAIFDCRMAEAYFKISLIESVHTDTMVLAHLLNENRRVGLKELAKEYFGEDSTKEQAEMKASVLSNGGKITKTQYEMYKCDSYILGKYGAKDALLTLKLFHQLIPELFEQNLDKFFYEDESMPLLRGPTYHLNTTGLRVDLPTLQSLRKQLQAECIEAKDFIYSEVGPRIKTKYASRFEELFNTKKPKFNLGSNQQLAWLLFDVYGLEYHTLTDAGRDVCKAMGLRLPYTIAAKRDFINTCTRLKGTAYRFAAVINGKKVPAKVYRDPWCYITVDKKTLAKLAPKFKWIESLLEYQRKTKLINTYINGIEERLQYGIIRPSFLQTGTTSGRYASRDPNFQNLPRDDKRIKETIIARSNHVFVGADYSQLEPRVFSYYSNDPRLLDVFKGRDDFYSTIGMEVYGKYDCIPRKDGSPEAFGIKYKKLRDLSKVIALASTYGATARQLAPTTGKSVEDTARDIEQYFEVFPRVRDYQHESHSLATRTGRVTNLFGRPRRMPDAIKIPKLYGSTPHDELPYEARNILNLAVNHRIQSTAASIVNRSAIRFLNDCKDLGIEVRLVLQVHDSLVAECLEKDAENVSLLLQNAMENTIDLKTVKLEAKPIIGKTLAEIS